MKDKYYTPEIEEFHVGFEFELWSSVAHTAENWEKEKIKIKDKDGAYGQIDIIEFIDDGCDMARVKYLDKEDIESLGFRVESDYWIIGEEYEPNYKISISFKDYSTGKTKYLIERTDFNKGVLFEGIIKNKSELKRLLKQLEI